MYDDTMIGGSATVPDRAATRVVDAQRQARRTLLVAVGFVVAAPLTALADPATGAWLPLHLFLLGGLVGAISAATQLLAVTWSAAPAPAERLAAWQRWSLAAGVVALAGGRELDASPLLVLGAAGVALAMVLLAWSLATIRSRSTIDRFHPAIDAYLAATGWAAFAVGLGATIALVDVDTWWPRLRAAHLTIALLGFVGLVIAATLPYFIATQARTKMSSRATSRALYRLTGALSVSVAVAVVGQLVADGTVAATGHLAYAVSLTCGLALLPTLGRKQLDWAGPRLVQLGAGWCWWVLAVVSLAMAELGHGPGVDRTVRAMVIGGFAQILVASLAYFGPVLRGGGHRRLRSGFDLTRSVPSLLAANVAAAAALAGNDALTVAVALVWAADVATRALRLRRPPPRSRCRW